MAQFGTRKDLVVRCQDSTCGCHCTDCYDALVFVEHCREHGNDCHVECFAAKHHKKEGT